VDYENLSKVVNEVVVMERAVGIKDEVHHL
jgi:hypothetical protein